MPAVARGARRTTNAREPRETQDESSNGPEQRKLRNRMSQRAFRARQAMRIQELEERLEQTTAPDMAWATQLQDQNMKLRQQLLEVHKKAINIQISLKALADAASKALGIDSMTLDNFVQTSDLEPSSNSEHTDTPPSDSTIELDRDGCRPTAQFNAELPSHSHAVTVATSCVEPSASEALLSDATWRGLNLDFFSGLMDEDGVATPEQNGGLRNGELMQQCMSIMPLQNSQLGLEHYQDLTERATAAGDMIPSLKKTNSTFSDHIDAFEACFAGHYSRTGQLAIANKQLLGAIEFMITAFVNTSWQCMSGWETYTRTLTALKDLTAWRMDRTDAKWRRIVPQYRPTRLQIAASHPSVIDWVPWPSLRDKLIIHHSSNPKLDQVLSDVGQAYVVQADLSTLVKCPQPVIGYVPVWALVQAITAGDGRADFASNPMHMSCSTTGMPAMEDFEFASAHSGGTHTSTSLPANNANELFSNATLAKEAHLLLGIGDGAAFNYRLDPAFFEIYPELYDSQSNVMAQGVRLRPNSRFADAPYPVPGALSASTITQYRELSKIALDCVAV